MRDEAAEVIQKELWHQCCEGDSDAILEALKREGFAVVELPTSPDHANEATEDEHGWRTWFTEYGTVQVSDSGCVAIDRIYRFSDLPEETTHLRTLAAALLAAADFAEEVSHA